MNAPEEAPMDERLVRETLSGDDEAFTELVRRYKRKVYQNVRVLFKSFVVVIYGLLVAASMMHPIKVQARGLSDQSNSADETISQMKVLLNLTEEQVTKVQPIIEESLKKRRYIINNSQQDKKTIRNELQQLQWATDIQLGEILTEEQMKEYQKIREEQHEKTPDRTEQGNGSRRGGLRGF